MADQIQPPASGAQAAPAGSAPAKVDPRAEALKVLSGGATEQPPKAPASAAAPATPTPGETTPASSASADAPAASTSQAPAEPVTAEALEKRQSDLARGFGKLATEKARLLAEQQATKAQREQLAKWAEAAEKVKADPAALLDVFGVDLETLAEAYLRRQNGTQAPTAEERLAKLESEKQVRETQEAEAKKKAEETHRAQAIDAGVTVVEQIVSATAEKFPVITTRGEYREVFQALGQYAQKHQLAQEDITPELVGIVAAAYEDARQAQLDEEISPLVSKVPRLAARMAPPRTNAPSGQKTDDGAKGTSSTLASPVTSEAPPPGSGRLTVEELRRRALAHFQPS